MYMHVGNNKKAPYYSVVGEATNFYVWVDESGRGTSSNWIKGQTAFDLWNRLGHLRKKNVEQFIELVKEIHEGKRNTNW